MTFMRLISQHKSVRGEKQEKKKEQRRESAIAAAAAARLCETVILASFWLSQESLVNHRPRAQAQCPDRAAATAAAAAGPTPLNPKP